MNNSGSKNLVDMIINSKVELSSEQLVSKILECSGELNVSEQTFKQLLDIASIGPVVGNNQDNDVIRKKIIRLYTLLVSSPEFQLA